MVTAVLERNNGTWRDIAFIDRLHSCQGWQDEIFVHRFILDEFKSPVLCESRTDTECRSFTFARLRDCVAIMILLICTVEVLIIQNC
jgi:hypothetical protein